MEIPASGTRVGDSVRAAREFPPVPYLAVPYLTPEGGSSGYSLYPHDLVWREFGPHRG